MRCQIAGQFIRNAVIHTDLWSPHNANHQSDKLDQMDSVFFGHEALVCNNRVVRDRKEKKMIKGFLKASNTIIIRFLGIALMLGLKLPFLFVKKKKAEWEVLPRSTSPHPVAPVSQPPPTSSGVRANSGRQLRMCQKRRTRPSGEN